MNKDFDEKIRPVAVADISSWLLFEKSEKKTYCIGSIERDKYIEAPEHLKDAIMCCIKHFDGSSSIEEIKTIVQEQYNYKIEVDELYNILCKANLIVNADASMVEKQEFDILSSAIFKMNLQKLYPFFNMVKKIVFPYGLYFTGIIIFLSIINVARYANIFLSPSTYKVQNSYLLSGVIAIFFTVVSLIIHELSHAVTAYKYGLKPSKLFFSTYMGFSLMVYLKIPGIYTLKPKQRVYVWLAGIYANLFLFSSCILLYSLVNWDIKNIFIIAAIPNISFVLSNLSPLLPLDGYFVLSTLLKRPNLRKGSFQEFKKWIFGEKNKFNGLVTLYFILSTLMMGTLVGTQAYWIIVQIMEYYNSSQTLLQFFLNLKFIIAIIMVILIKIIVSKLLEIRNRNAAIAEAKC